MRLMFECSMCGHLGINPVCEACPIIEPLELDDDLIVAEEIIEEPEAADSPAEDEDFEDFILSLDLGEDDIEDEAVVVDLSEEDSELEGHFEDDSNEDFELGDEDEDN
jgi:hypothetical protein